MKRRKNLKRILATFLAFAMIVTGIHFAKPEAEEAKASGTKAQLEPNTPDKDMLNVKMQASKTYKNEEGANVLDLRILSSVNGLGYKEVGFEVWYGDDIVVDENGELTTKPTATFTTQTVLKSIEAGVKYEFNPKVIDACSEYFVTGTIKGILSTNINENFYIKAFCVEMDKTEKIYGAGRYFNVEQATADATINIPIEMATLPEGVHVGDTGVSVTVKDTATTASVENFIEGCVHLNIAVPGGNKAALPSASKVTLGDVSTIYRNLKSTGSGDDTWYKTVKMVYPAEEEFIIANNNDLLALAKIVDDGDTMKGITVHLAAPEFDLNPGWDASTKTAAPEAWEPIGEAAMQYEGIFNGANSTIKGIYASQNGGECVGLFARITADAKIKNLELSNSYIEGVGDAFAVGSIAGRSKGEIISVKADESVYVTSSNVYMGGIVGMQEGTLDSVWFAGTVIASKTHAGGMIGTVWDTNDDYTMKNCLYTGTLTGADCNIGGLIGSVQSSTSIENCLSNGKIYATKSWNLGSVLGVMPTKYTLTMEGIYTTGMLYNAEGTSSLSEAVGDVTSTSYNGTNWTKISSDDIKWKKSAHKLNGFDFFSKDNTDGIWIATDGYGPQLTKFAELMKPDYSWFYDVIGDKTVVEGMNFEIETVNQLITLPEIADTFQHFKGNGVSFYKCTITLTHPNMVYDLNPGWDASTKEAPTGKEAVIWNPIGEAGNTFGGTFDGNGAIIKGVYVKETQSANYPAECLGFFARAYNSSTIKNFTLSNSCFVPTGVTWVGSVVGRLGTSGNIGAKVSSVIVDESVYINSSGGQYTGGIVGQSYGTITDVQFSGEVFGSEYYVGGIAGYTAGNIENVYFDGKVTSPNRFAGGIVGELNGIIKNAWAAGEVVHTGEAAYTGHNGGMVGSITKSSSEPVMKNCLFTGVLNTKKCNSGGLIGSVSVQTVIENCLSNGKVYTGQAWQISSVVGILYGSASLTMNNVYTTGGLYALDKSTVVAENMVNEVANSTTPTFTILNIDDIKGDAAITALSGFDFYSDTNTDGVWITNPNGGPELKRNNLFGKTIVFDGDSICHATTETQSTNRGWAYRIGNKNNMSWSNYGIGGGTITAETYYSSGRERHWVSRNVDIIHEEVPELDYLILEGGSNDADFVWNTDKRGTFAADDYSGNYDDATFCGALETLFYKAKTYYPEAKIGFIIAQKMGDNETDQNRRRECFDTIIQICEKWEIPYIDLWEISGLDPLNDTIGAYTDGQHLSAIGYDVISPMIEEWIRSL